MAKRGSTGLCFVVGVDKPTGMSSHDVVNRVRRIFGERRVGHTGTLDPLASGALSVCVGPATRLDKYMVGHDKTYCVKIEFGTATSTDDAGGEVIHQGEIPDEAYEEDFAREYLANLVGRHLQMPPVYSAIKVNGQRAYAAARKGNVIDLKPREIEVYDARLVSLDEGCIGRPLTWTVELSVSKGTYVRSIARDIGLDLGSFAHVRELRRTKSGALSIEDCVSLETLESVGLGAAVDPVLLLGFRILFADERQGADVSCGRFLDPSRAVLYDRVSSGNAACDMCACTGGIVESSRGLEDGELVSVVAGKRLVAVYRFDKGDRALKPDCVFSTGVVRSGDIEG